MQSLPTIRKRERQPMTDDQKETYKRIRLEKKEELHKTKEHLLIEANRQSNERLVIEQTLETLNNQNMTQQIEPTLQSQADYLFNLTMIIISQQNLITNMNTRIKNRDEQLKIELEEAHFMYCGERDKLMDEIAFYKEREVAPQQQPKMITNKKVKEEMVDKSLYTWQVVTSQSSQCLDLYGFDANQIQKIYNRYFATHVKDPRSKKGPKTIHLQNDILLTTLHFFVHYETVKAMADKFGISSARLQPMMYAMIMQFSIELFRYSIENFDMTSPLVYHVHFVTVNRPMDSNVASDYFNKETKNYGLYIHCIHDGNTGKVVAFEANNSNRIDSSWVIDYIPSYDACVEMATPHTVISYITRMKNKFLFTNTKFRGSLPDLPSIIGFLLALVNIDLNHDNPIKTKTQIPVDDDDDDVVF